MATEWYYDGTQWVQVTGLTVYLGGGGTPSTGLETFNMFNLIQVEDAELTLISLSAL